MSLPTPPATVHAGRLAILLPALLLVLAAAPRAQQEGADPRASLPLSTFDSVLHGKLGADGSIDSGAAVLRFFHGDTDAPLDRQRLRYGAGPELWATYFDEVGDASVNLRALAMPRRTNDEERVEVAVQLAFENPFRQPRSLHLRVEVSPGGGDPLERPHPSLPFEGAPAFELEENLLLRDGTAVFYWDPDGVQPQVTMPAAPAGPDDPALVLDFVVDLQPREARWAGLHLGGPRTAPDADEAAWRKSLQRYSYERLEEMTTWQSQVRPTYFLDRIGALRLAHAMRSSVHLMRSLGDAHLEIRALSDRPYGHPPTDGAVEPGMLAVLTEWGMGNFALPRLDAAVLAARERVGDLPVDRRLAFLEGACRAARLMPVFEHDVALAEAVLELGAEGPVPVWADPDQVRSSFEHILVRAGLGDRVDELPALHFAEAPAGTTAAHFVAARRALAAGDARGCWTHVEAIMERTNPDGMGRLLDGGALDAAFSTAVMSLARGLLVDDYGDDLIMMPGMVSELLPETNKIELRGMHTVFGSYYFSLYWSRKERVIGGQVSAPSGMPPERILVRPPLPYRLRGVQIQKGGGRMKTLKDGSLKWDFVPGRKMEFNVGVKRDTP